MAASCLDEVPGRHQDRLLTSDDPDAPVPDAAERPLPPRTMWLFGALGAVVALVLAPSNPGGWFLLVALAWITPSLIRRR
ncbi:hypothetical protein ACFO0M_02575 [Micromonospora mangrovi]|uniref:Uncharacterized protein n=2 Tax=Micromonospora TaxID=1873 RepID=A0AAU7M0H2_9ACTN